MKLRSRAFDYVPEMPKQLKKPGSLVRTAPDPESDRKALLEIRDSGSPQAKELAERLVSDEAWCSSPLGELLPGLALIDAPNFSIRLSVRAANPVLKADLATLRALATRAPVDLLALPGFGKRTVEEVLATAVSEWAAAYLGEDEKGEKTRPQQSADDPNTFDPREHQRRLSDALDEIEGTTGFEAFRRRKLDPGESPSQSEVAAALGLKPEQVPHYERAIREAIGHLTAASLGVPQCFSAPKGTRCGRSIRSWGVKRPEHLCALGFIWADDATELTGQGHPFP
jgi:hypothetical protein